MLEKLDVTNMTKYWIVDHVHLCATPEGVVFLDMKKDRYLGFGGSDLSYLQLLISGWPIHSPSAPRASDEALQEAVEACELLLRNGLLTRTRPLRERSPSPFLEPLAPIPMCNRFQDKKLAIRFHHVVFFVLACAKTAISLRLFSLHTISEAVRARKRKAAARQTLLASSTPMEALVDVFNRIRPYFYTGRDHCLFHALTLTNFLAFYRQFPTWVIGVRMDPFAAHSWVQHAGTAFDDYFDEVFSLIPIHAV